MAASLGGYFNLQAFTDLGALGVGMRVYTYATGTTTHKTAYTDAAGTVPHTYTNDGLGGQYIACDARGELPAPLFLSSGAYDIALKTAAGVTVWTRRSVGTDEAATTAVSQLIADLADDTSATKGAGLIGYSRSLSYASDTIGGALKAQRINVKLPPYNAVGDGVADDTAAMAAAHATGKVVYYPAGTYKFSRLTTGITSGGIVGEGQTQTVLLSTDISVDDLITFTGDSGTGLANQLTFQDFQIQGTLSGYVPAKSGGAAIAISPASGENSYATFNNVMIAFVPICIDFVAASLWKVIGCNFLSYNVAGIQVANTNSADSGDSAIIGCVFNNPFLTGSGVWQKSSGGLKIVGNKFLGGERAYTMALEDSTSVLVISGNSMENMAGADVALTQAVAGKNFVNVCITGNEFSVGGIAIATDSNAFLSEVNISANQINMGAVGSNACIALNNVTDFYVGSNIIKGNGGLGSSAVNIANCANGKIGINTYSNLPTPIVVAGSSNVSYELDHQSGSATTANSWSAYGSLWISSTTTVTFPQPFLMTPSPADVTLTPGAGSGEVGAVISSVTKTQLQFAAISVNNTAARTISWQVRGVL
jgi:hypothetical protein